MTTPSDLIESMTLQSELLIPLLKKYHLNYETTEIKIGAKTKSIYIISRIYCDEGFEYICEQLISKYATEVKEKKGKDVEVTEVDDGIKK